MRVKPIFALVITLLVVIATRLYYVETFAIPLPFWDQWDAEGDYLLRPWIEGRLEPHNLWQTHNEHRIFPTRLLSLLIFSITGVWDNLVEARINIFLAACIPLIIILFLIRQRAVHGFRWLVLLAIIPQFSLLFAFENILVGFQSQFYFLVIFTLLALILAVRYPDSLLAMAGVLLLSWLSVLTMASGILTPLAALGVYALQALNRRKLGALHLVMVAALVAATVQGYRIMPHIEANHVFRARNLGELLGALKYLLAWPVAKSWPAAAALWLPAWVMVPWLMRKGAVSRADLFMAGCVMWSLAQALAIGYGRGQEMISVSSRYTELFSIGLIGNGWFAARFMEVVRKWQVAWLGAVFFVVFVLGHITRRGSDMRAVYQTHGLSLKQHQNVMQYLQTNDPSALVQPQFEIPYPDSVRLRSLLDNPTLRRILPRELKQNAAGK